MDELQQYILRIVDVAPDGNCAYKEIVVLLGQGEESWSFVRQDLIWEIET